MPAIAFQIVGDAVPDFHKTYYSGFTAPYQLAFNSVAPFELNGVSHVVINLNGWKIPQGRPDTGPAANREMIFRIDPAGRLVDVTQQLLGSAGASTKGLALNSSAAQVVIADINGDGRSDILVAANSEDGRAASDAAASNKRGQSQVHLSQPDGTYKLVDIGDPLWGAMGSIQVVNSGGQTLIHLAGIDAPAGSSNLFSEGLSFVTQPIYRLNSDGLTFSKVGYAPSNNYGSLILSESRMVTQGFGTAGYKFALVDKGANGSWTVTSQIDPFPAHKVNNHISWNNELTLGTTARFVDGEQVFEAFYAIFGQLGSKPGGTDLILANLTGMAISKTRADGNYHATDATSITRFFLLELKNGALVQSAAKLIGENRYSGSKGVQLLDLDNDGLTDIVSTNIAYDRGGMPDVYLNDGRGNFLRVDPAVFPTTGVTSAYGTFLKVGDRYDLLVTPSGVGDVHHQEPVYLKALGAFPTGAYVMSASDLVGNLDALQGNVATGRIASIALEDKTTPTLALTPAQLAANKSLLGKVSSTFEVSVDASALNGAVEGLTGRQNTVGFSAPSGQYVVTLSDSGVKVSGQGAVASLSHVQWLQFAGVKISVAETVTSTLFTRVLREDAKTGPHAALAVSISNLISTGTDAPGQILKLVVDEARATSSVATLSYAFFTGKTPSAGGMDYLVSPTGPNANNLNSTYYQSFSLENRYINFAVNLGKQGEGKAQFLAQYGELSLFEATRKAYATIFGAVPSDAKLAALLDPSFSLNGVTMTRSEYFASYGQDGVNGLGTKAAMVGWLLAEAVKADVGMYAKANTAFWAAVAFDNAPFTVDLVGQYGQPGYVFQPG